MVRNKQYTSNGITHIYAYLALINDINVLIFSTTMDFQTRSVYKTSEISAYIVLSYFVIHR